MPYQTRTILAAAFVTALTTLMPASSAMAQDAQPDAILGTWQTESGNLVIEAYDAGDTYAARFIYGDLIVEADGTTLKKDTQNPDPALQSRSLQDVNFVSGLVWDAGDARWESGTLYQAATGQTASARITIEGDRLQLRAYRGTPLAGRTIVFERRAN